MHPETDDSTSSIQVQPSNTQVDLRQIADSNPWYIPVLVTAIGAVLYKAIPAVWTTVFKTSSKDSERFDQMLKWQQEYMNKQQQVMDKLSDSVDLQSRSLATLAELQKETLSKVAAVQEAIIRIFAELPRKD
jgi:hypothetical protein